jgi:membrane protein insertase Oxa1/YidC/SpoIIIJ
MISMSENANNKKAAIKELLELGKQKGVLTAKEIEEALAEFEFDAEQLEKLPDVTFFGIGDLGANPAFTSLTVLIPVIAAALTWLSMFLSRKWNGSVNVAQEQQNPQMQQTTKMMDLMMPGMTLFMAFGFSGMMGIYWIYQSALGILQTYLMSKFMPIPKYTEEELKEIRSR